MRLDHLLSREPIFGDARLAGLVGCVFLVPALSHYCLGGGCGCVFWVGHKCYARGKHAVGFTFNTCWALCLQLLMLDGFLVLVVVWCVVCDLYSG